MVFAKLPYFSDVIITDKQIDLILARSARKVRKGGAYQAQDGGGKRFLAEPFAEDPKRKIMSMTPKSGSEVVRKILYGGSITRNGNTVHFDGKNSHPLKLHLEAPGFNPQRGGVTIEDIEKFLPLALAQEAKIEKRKNKKGKITSNKIYKIAENGVIYTLVTASRGEFRSFYSNKKAANAVTDPNRSSATGMLHNDNIPQLSENANGTEENGRERIGTDGADGADGLRFSIAEYSEDEQRDIVDILKPFTGSILDKNPEDYAAYLREHGVDIPEKDAYRFAQEAARQKMKQARKAADKRRDNWLYDNGRILSFLFY